MDRNELIIKLIKEAGYSSVKAFAEKCGMPYTTLHSMLKRGIGNASIDNVMLICKNLGITVEQLEKADLFDTPTYAIGENGKREVRYSDNSATGKEKDNDTLLAEMGVKRTNYIMSKKNERTELSDNEYDFLINSLELFRKK